MERKLMGYAAVDSGQLLICDPCYIDGEWSDEDFEDIRIYKHVETGDTLQYRVDFENFESPIEKYKGLNMNQLIATGEWEKAEAPTPKNSFSYNGCAKETLSNEGFGQLLFKMGHPGAGVAFATTIGDGYYPVFGNFTEDGYLKNVEIQILEDEEENDD